MRGLQKLGLFAVTLLLVSCGRGGGYKSLVTDSDNLTGGQTTVTDSESGTRQAVNNTISGHREEFEALKKKIDINIDNSLSSSVRDVQVVKGANGRVNVTVSFKSKIGSTERIQYQANTSNGLATDVASTQAPAHLGDLLMDLNCSKEDCSVAEVILHRKTKNNVPSGKVGILVTQDTDRTKVLRNRNVKRSNAEFDVINNTPAANLTAERSSIAVVGGPSSAVVRLVSQEGGQRKVVAEVDTDLFETAVTAGDVRSTKLGGSTPTANVSGRLIGNNSNSGSIALELKDKDHTGTVQDSIVVILEPEYEEEPSDEQQTELPAQNTSGISGANSNAVFRLNLSNPNLSVAKDMSLKLDKYANNKKVQKMIQGWLGQPTGISCYGNPNYGTMSRSQTERFINYTRPVAPYMAKTLESIDVTPELGYILSVESLYSTKGDYPIQVASSSSAGGPWQLLTGTAIDIRNRHGVDLNIFPVEGYGSSKKLNPNDDRNFLIPSTRAAGTYFKKDHYRMFSHDMGLVILGYKSGQGEVQNTLNRIESLGNYELTLDQVDSLNMVNGGCGETNYVYQYLAMKFIGSNPEAYGITQTVQVPESAYIHTLDRPK